jgi:hypothetical protein
MEADTIYFARRASEERAAAARADHPSAQEAHLALAERYEDLVAAIDRRNYALGLDLYDAA